jgi:alkylation response protein AidB-like acyl-CoA dehydrogenase
MDFRDSTEQAEFRAKAARWLDGVCGDFPPQTDLGAREEQGRRWQALLHESGWLGLAWPAEYGGHGYTVIHEAIFSEECTKRNMPLPVNLVGLLLAGPTIIAHGTDAQKNRYLPGILSAEEIWCQGFSEPGNGSDLAGMTTRAVRADGGWRVSGQKVWTSAGHLANKCLLLARTDPDASRHSGISYFLADTAEFDIRRRDDDTDSRAQFGRVQSAGVGPAGDRRSCPAHHRQGAR